MYIKQGSLLCILHSYSMFLTIPQISIKKHNFFLVVEKMTEKFCHIIDRSIHLTENKLFAKKIIMI